jgi:DNA-binding beta-propeller fold protein YncE
VSLGEDRELSYLGVFCANAKYKKSTKFARALEAMGATSVATSNLGDSLVSPAGAPPKMLVPVSRFVEDYEAPFHAIVSAPAETNLAILRNTVVTFAYGAPQVMANPQYVTTDSMQRVVISDPDLRAVHVFDPRGKTSFSILGDHGHRLQLPAGVAVDDQDNIYIADSGRGIVLVYDRYGQFVRHIGLVHGENMYARPTAIAVDRKARRLYLADSPRNLIFVLDLEGNELKRMGTDRNGRGSGNFLSPTQVAVNDHGIVVMDSGGSRLQILDSDGNLIHCYVVVAGSRPGGRENGLAVDRDGNIYISYVALSMIGIYHANGTPAGTFGQFGERIGEFEGPRGMWVDDSNRIYVADTTNARVPVFQISTGAAARIRPLHGSDLADANR